MPLTKSLCAASARACANRSNGAITTTQNFHPFVPRCIVTKARNPFSASTKSDLTKTFRTREWCSFKAYKNVSRSFSVPDTSQSNFAPVLPISCPGCGALSQEVDPIEAGYYSRNRKAVKVYLKTKRQAPVNDGNDDDSTQYRETTSQGDSFRELPDDAKHDADLDRSPICDRCHDLIYNSKGRSIAHPSVEDIADSIAESPFKRNHVYHVLDAADFPMSLFPKVFESLELAKPRSQNRRARHKFTARPSLSFIITRSDLLAPSKEMVDSMLPYFQSVLRKALGRVGRHMRLGNVHLVSAKRGWWTSDIKEKIWERGGGNWMVGRVNVGKSNLFEVLFPKGSGDRAPVYAELQQAQHTQPGEENGEASLMQPLLKEDSLLPPAQPEVRFPTMPVVSSLPGTTASPIRLPFGGHKGELIDLPGLERGNLEEFVQTEHKLDLVMQHRPNVQQHVIRPGQSLLLGGGLIRITPELDENDPSTTMLAYPFVPVDAHVTSTEKAIGAQRQERESGIQSILAEGAGVHTTSAGTFKLDANVTKAYAGPLVRAGVSTSKLAFVVYSTDILIEGVGWVELVCQVRKSRKMTSPAVSEMSEPSATWSAASDEVIRPDSNFCFRPFATQIDDARAVAPVQDSMELPRVEVFSPHGKHISHRHPIGAWMIWDSGRKRRARASAASRQRKPMAGAKKQAKLAIRAKMGHLDSKS